MLKLSAFAVLFSLLLMVQAVPLGKNEGNQGSAAAAKLMPQLLDPIPNNPVVHQPTNLDGCDIQCPPGSHCFLRCGWGGCSPECVDGVAQDNFKRNNGNQGSIAKLMTQVDPIPNNPAVHQPSNLDDQCDIDCPPGSHCFLRCGWGGCFPGCVVDMAISKA
ncbi:unnamed protein product, partial [Mesorhabditis belari]|uniref:WAP domain-containing protein n=1 Tax=Mesorhabditis belari TaxID=2138241 RepID=A0AAF3EGA3_9BILA